MPRNVSECVWVSINVECPDSARFLVLSDLFLEELGEV